LFSFVEIADNKENVKTTSAIIAIIATANIIIYYLFLTISISFLIQSSSAFSNEVNIPLSKQSPVYSEANLCVPPTLSCISHAQPLALE